MGIRERLSALPRLQKWGLGLALAVLLYGLIGFFVAPALLRSQGEQALRQRLGREARIGEVRINPFALSLAINDFELLDRDGSAFVRFDALSADFELSSVFRGAFTFADVRVVAPFLHVKILPDGTLNAGDLLESEETDAEPAEPTPPPPLWVGLAVIERGRIVFSDLSHATPFEHEISPLDVALHDFGTRPDDESPYSFKATTGAGEVLDWEGSLSVVPLYSSGRFSLTGIQPRTGWLYVQDDVFFEVVNGTVDVHGRYSFDTREGLQADLEEGEIRIRNFEVAERETGDLAVSIPAFDVEGISLSHPENRVRIASIGASGGAYHLLRFADGDFRAQRLSRTRSGMDAPQTPLATVSATSGSPGSAADPGAAWSVIVDRVQLKGQRIAFEDRSTVPVVEVGVELVELELREVTNDPTRPIPVALQLSIGEQGSVALDGRVRVQPQEVDLEVEVSSLDLRPFEPYWASALAIDLSSAQLGIMKGVLESRGDPQNEPTLRYAGSFRVDDLQSLDKRLASELFSWSALELDGLELTVEPTSVRLAKLTLREPAAHVILAPDGTFNLATLIATDSDAEAPQEPTEAAGDREDTGPAVPVSVGVVEIVGGELDFEDRSVSPRFRTGVTALSGTVEGLSSDVAARAKVALAGELDGATPMKIAGVVSPLANQAELDLRISFENFELSPFTPYSGRYVGKAIERGKLFVELEYRLEDRHLVGQNKLFLDQFTLGGDVDSPDAIDLPVGLAIALLKDRKGEIHVDLPVSGDVDDPDFSVVRIVFGALRNLITKVALSPFSMIGGLVGSDGDAMRSVAFAPGSASLDAEATGKLDAVAKALAERPALSIELVGNAAVEIDRSALQVAALDMELRRFRFRELQDNWFGDKPATAEEVIVTPEERGRLIRRAFEEQFANEPDPLLPAVSGDESGEPTAIDEDALEKAREADMARRLADEIEIGPAALRELAGRRADVVRDRLVEVGGVPPARVFVLDPDVHPAGTGQGAATTLSLAAY